MKTPVFLNYFDKQKYIKIYVKPKLVVYYPDDTHYASVYIEFPAFIYKKNQKFELVGGAPRRKYQVFGEIFGIKAHYFVGKEGMVQQLNIHLSGEHFYMTQTGELVGFTYILNNQSQL